MIDAGEVLRVLGDEIDADDVRDVMALHRRFGIPLPPEYERAAPPGGDPARSGRQRPAAAANPRMVPTARPPSTSRA